MNNKTIQNPNAPASFRQTFAIFCKTGYDVRGCTPWLTMQQASDILDGRKQASEFAGAVLKKSVKPKAVEPKVDFSALYAEAHLAGMEAGTKAEAACHGGCGFAWVNFDGRTPWGKWAKANRVASPSSRGLQIWVSHFGQSVNAKDAYAEAFRAVLIAHGITAYAGSRLD